MREFSLRDKGFDWIKTLTAPRSGASVLCAVLFLAYAVLPIGIAAALDVDSSFFTVAGLTAFAVVVVLLGASLSFFDPWFDGRRPRVAISGRTFHTILWSAFVVFAFVAWFTAPQIPLVAALTGADPATIAVLRDQFLKAREGWQASFVYINAILTGALIPYSLALMFVHAIRWRWIAMAFFLVFCLSFVEKTFFLKAMVPLFVLVAQGKATSQLSSRTVLLIVVGLLLFITWASGSGSQEDVSGDSFFSVSYTPTNIVDHIIWRVLAIPLLTAADAIRLFEEQFRGGVFFGATSSFFSSLLGLERIDFERQVFAAQWGQNETGTGSANSVFITEAFVNFGWLGVFVFSFTIGLLMRLFALSRDEAFRAQWPLFALGLHSAGLIGLLLSNGFALLFAIALFIRIRVGPSGRRRTLSP